MEGSPRQVSECDEVIFRHLSIYPYQHTCDILFTSKILAEMIAFEAHGVCCFLGIGKVAASLVLSLSTIQTNLRSDFWKVRSLMVIIKPGLWFSTNHVLCSQRAKIGFLQENMPAFGAVLESGMTWICWGKGFLYPLLW